MTAQRDHLVRPAIGLRRTVAMVAAGCMGAGLTWWLAMAAGMTTGETLRIAGIAGAAAGVAGVLGALGLRALRRAPVGAQVAVVGLASIATTAVGAILASEAMFLSGHDLHALAVILSAAATIGLLLAMVLGAMVGRAARSLSAATRRIGEGHPAPPPSAAEPSEFARLARDLERMTERLDQSRRRERAIESSRRELVAWISHDLRTPLAAIRAMAEALEDGVVDDPETVATYHRTLRSEADRLALMVDDLFELSRINAGALRLELTRVALDDVVSDAMASADAVARRKGVTVTGTPNGSAPVVAVAQAELGRAIRNLIENAIRHTPAHGTVVLETGLRDGRAFVSVEDECGGIPPADLDRVFDLAFRGQTARTPGPDAGAGLGLAIARGIAEAHHGDLSVRNAGRGCRFTLRLPPAAGGDPPEGGSRSGAAPTGGSARSARTGDRARERSFEGKARAPGSGWRAGDPDPARTDPRPGSRPSTTGA